MCENNSGGSESERVRRKEKKETLTRPSPAVIAKKSREGLKAVKMPLMSVEAIAIANS